MTANRTPFRLKLITWTIVLLAVLQVAVGSYPDYPFIHWTMFAFNTEKPVATTISQNVVVAQYGEGQSTVIHIKRFFSAVPGSGGTSKAVEKDYLSRLRSGDLNAVAELTALAQDRLGLQGITSLRVEKRTWTIPWSSLGWHAGENGPTPRAPFKAKEITTYDIRTGTAGERPDDAP